MLVKLPPAVVERFQLQQRLFSLIKVYYLITDDLFETHLEIPQPINQVLFGVLVLLTSFVPGMMWSSFTSMFTNKTVFTDDELL
jgi:hypothetical protein